MKNLLIYLFLTGLVATQVVAQSSYTKSPVMQKIISSQNLSLEAARQLIETGLSLARTQQLQICIAVTDASGQLLAFARMDQAALVSIEVAMGKARTAAYLKAPSKLFEDFVNAGMTSITTVPGVLPLQGGMPVLLNGQMIGAVGVSGSTGDQDQAIATAIAESFKL